MTLPPAKPSSITSMKRVLGVKSDFTDGRSTPFSRNTSSVSPFSFAMYGLVKMSPCVCTSAIATRLAPPNTFSYSRYTFMYGCWSGTILLKPASTARRDAESGEERGENREHDEPRPAVAEDDPETRR